MVEPGTETFHFFRDTGKRRWLTVTAVAALGAALFTFVWRIIRPEVVYFVQMPVFFSGRRFFAERLGMPGGFIDYLSAYLTDGFQTGWGGALILTALFCLTAWLLARILIPGGWWIAIVLPVALLFLLHTRATYLLSSTLSFILSLQSFYLYRRLSWIGPWRWAVAVPFLFFLAVLSPFAMILTAVLCGIYEAFQAEEPLSRRLFVLFGFLMIAWLIPRITAAWMFLTPLREAYFRHAPFLARGSLRPLGLGLVLLTVTLMAASLAGLFRIRPKDRVVYGLQAILLVLILFFSVNDLSRHRGEREVNLIRRAAHDRRWGEVLKWVNDRTLQHPLCVFHIYRAFSHLGRMGSDFFTLPQYFGSEGLFLSKEVAFQFPLDRSDFYFEIGHINEAKRWASEALTLYGEATPVLKRLALVHLIQDEIPAAVRILQRLRQNPHSRRWADHYLACLSDPARMRAETELQRLHAMRPQKDFIVMTTDPAMDLERMLNQFPQNRMAVEYLLIHHLLERDLESFTRLILRYRPMIKGPLPRHFEEALIAYLSIKKEAALPGAREVELRRSTLDRFQHLERILKGHRNDLGAAYPFLKEAFSDTYWFYLLYPSPTSGR